MKNFDVVFESDNIIFTKLSILLVNDYLKMINDPNVANKISHKIHTYTYDEEINWINDKLNKKAIFFSMLEKGTNEFIGNIELKLRNNGAEIGISITPDKQNKHYGREALKTIIKYGIDVLKLEDFDLNVYSNNPRAIACYEHVGFVKDGIGKEQDDIHMKYMR